MGSGTVGASYETASAVCFFVSYSTAFYALLEVTFTVFGNVPKTMAFEALYDFSGVCFNAIAAEPYEYFGWDLVGKLKSYCACLL